MKISVLSSNMWLLPPPASIDNQKRLTKFIKLVSETRPDIVNLQEVWLKPYISQIKNKLSNYHFVSTKSWLYNKSGLVTLTKYRPVDKKIHYFKIKRQYNPIERIAGKGFLRVQFEINGKKVSVINVHIYHSRQVANLKLKLNQISQVLKVAKENGPMIVAGDLNTPPNYYKNKLKRFLTEKNIPESYSENNKYSHAMVNALMNKEGIYNPYPDRIFYYPKSKTIKLKTQAIKDPLISDHYPLFSEINLS